jgi:Ca-activated chloride channel family protein
VGVGVGNGYNDTLMDTVTDAGRGAYIFIDTREEAHRMFEHRFIQSIEVAAYDVRVRLTLPGVFRIEEYHGEEYSEIAKEVTPQHLAPNDAMIFHQLLAASRPDRVYADDVIRVQVTWKRSPDGADATVGISNTLQRLIDTPCPEMRKADAIVVYAQALMRISAAYDRHELSEASSTCYDALHIVGAAASALDDDELREIEDLLTRYCTLF